MGFFDFIFDFSLNIFSFSFLFDLIFLFLNIYFIYLFCFVFFLVLVQASFPQISSTAVLIIAPHKTSENDTGTPGIFRQLRAPSRGRIKQLIQTDSWHGGSKTSPKHLGGSHRVLGDSWGILWDARRGEGRGGEKRIAQRCLFSEGLLLRIIRKESMILWRLPEIL